MPEPVTLLAVGTGIVGLTAELARRYFEVAKDVFDVVAGALALVVFSPVLAVCAILIKLSSRGPVIFKQVRVGKDGELFTMIKFRTMRTNAEARTGAAWAQDDDPRILPLCRWMRFSHVDELPQLINVIRGQMSLVGPRPERPEILADLEKHYPNVRKRLEVRPGITGLAQIRNGYDTTVDAFRDKLGADLEYIENRRWLLELKILIGTFGKFNDRQAK